MATKFCNTASVDCRGESRVSGDKISTGNFLRTSSRNSSPTLGFNGIPAIRSRLIVYAGKGGLSWASYDLLMQKIPDVVEGLHEGAKKLGGHIAKTLRERK